jgi:hypothetical protein
MSKEFELEQMNKFLERIAESLEGIKKDGITVYKNKIDKRDDDWDGSESPVAENLRKLYPENYTDD